MKPREILTVWVLNCDSGVPNRVGNNGCSLADRVAEIVTQASADTKNHGDFVSRVANALNALVAAGVITIAEHDALMTCVGQSGT